MSTTPIAEVAVWVETAIFLLASAATGIYVAVCMLIAIKRAGTLPRRLGLLAALAVFLFGWAILGFVGFGVTLMAATLDVQAAPSNPKHWRQLTVMGCSAFAVIGLGVPIVWAIRHLVVSGQKRSGPGDPVPDIYKTESKPK